MDYLIGGDDKEMKGSPGENKSGEGGSSIVQVEEGTETVFTHSKADPFPIIRCRKGGQKGPSMGEV